MNIIRYPEKSEWAKIVERPHLDVSQLNETVASVLADVKRRGDDAVKGYELKFDHVDLPDLAVSEAEMNEAPEVSWQEGRDTARCHLLAEEHCHREGGSLYPWWYCPTLLYRPDAGHTRKDCRLSGDCALHASRS